jgi:hypothetical protein
MRKCTEQEGILKSGGGKRIKAGMDKTALLDIDLWRFVGFEREPRNY